MMLGLRATQELTNLMQKTGEDIKNDLVIGTRYVDHQTGSECLM